MSISPLSSSTNAGTADISRLVQRLVTAADQNKDGQLSTSEFGSFLTSLIGHAPTAATDLKGTMPGLASPPATAATAPFNEVPGFVLSKIQDPTHVSQKYSAALRVFSQAIGGLKPSADSLPSIVTFAQANGFPKAAITKSDSIDFGDGAGPIDLIVDVDGPNAAWSFQNW
jgi:hypothetical protein